MWELVGIKNTSFTDKQTGQLVEGKRLYFARDLDNPEDGVEVRTDYLSLEKIKKFALTLKLGTKFMISTDRYGRIDMILAV